MIRVFICSAGILLRTFWRATRQFFHEVTGAMFGVFAIYGVLAAWRGWRHKQDLWIVALPAGYAAMMAIFAALSFRSARRVR
jgi:glycerol uptake facilitator-like aquaporin